MMAILIQAWRDLGATGKMVVGVVLILAAAGLLAMAMYLGYNLDWLPGILGGAAGG